MCRAVPKVLAEQRVGMDGYTVVEGSSSACSAHTNMIYNRSVLQRSTALSVCASERPAHSVCSISSSNEAGLRRSTRPAHQASEFLIRNIFYLSAVSEFLLAEGIWKLLNVGDTS